MPCIAPLTVWIVCQMAPPLNACGDWDSSDHISVSLSFHTPKA